ncbi:hypothetical protein A2926_02575 [Candidatus Giovannonibacteria bacterium RIFCSPLOWO2_01_FULL_44_40]|nr:MAG: hypothetical protein A3C77_02880 [Candidatus Giovannonibacteria bacterium RIFCSPHIGHO2_02_FULL_45_13]OGF79578.1 MAG: hypothetical protein A2926_02575 [Candidatus Giovannonibacteria bacterium RIFCSPLOWO2_01_FULL_44_40]
MLTKTDFMKYMECPVGLWMEKHRPDLIPEDTPEVRRVLEMGREVDDFSRKLFEGGVEVAGYNQEGWQNTKKLIESGVKILYQPTVVADPITCRADILEKSKNTWTLNEVKSATTVKKEYPYDVAFQRICFENAGIKLDRTNLVHINNQYVRRGDIQPEKLFVSEDITDMVLEKTDEVKHLIPLALKVLNRREAPDEEMLATCPSPRNCEYLNIYLESVGQIPEEPRIEETTDVAGIAETLAELQYPLYFLDYETYGSPIPPFDGTRPYQNIPFQYSLGIKDAPDANTRYEKFLARTFKDSVPGLLAQLRRDIGERGSVIVWNESFEKGCNDEMARMEPDYADFLKAVNDRIFDLMVIFKLKNQLYTRNAFQKSASLKMVLPAICPELAYDDLTIQEGATASASWPVLTSTNTSKADKAKLADDMLSYCKRDTEAMVCILKKLQQEINK